ncbi:hypothetical protein FRC04_008313 [Tulasnella sp. 424]|nr:hypothetical protein FRC04_008313 [Tulasnella sp. 424]
MFEEPSIVPDNSTAGTSGDDSEPHTPTGPRNPTAEDVRVHIHYDVEDPPQPPDSTSWTRFVCISDTHGKSFPVPPGDVLLHAGDLTAWGSPKELRKTMEWLVSLPHPLKIVIAGNHDFALDRTKYAELAGTGDDEDDAERQEMDDAEEIMRGELAQEGNVVYLKNESHEFKVKPEGRTWSIYGSPWTPYFGGMAFNYSKEEAEGIVGEFPRSDILLTHGPPHGIHDETLRGELVGCPTLLAYLARLRPRLHVFGHIHEARGATIHSWDTESAIGAEEGQEREDRNRNTSTVFVNPANQPIGAKATKSGRWLKTGSEGWTPIIVDIRD